jgi:putative glutathione S-transferase
MTSTARFASPIDAYANGEYRPWRDAGPFASGRLGTARWPAEAGRYHVYAAASSAASHRVAILRELHELADVISLSYVHGLRDARGWAFRESTGPDPVNGFALLREAYEATEPGFAGDVRVPVLWDRESARIVSTDAVAIGIDIATRFGSTVDTYPRGRVDAVERFARWLRAELNPVRAMDDLDEAVRMRRALAGLDRQLSRRTYVLGARPTDADIRLWVELVRLDAGPNAHGRLGPRLDSYTCLWRWAQRLYDLAAFRRTTDFVAFTAPFADLPPWA